MEKEDPPLPGLGSKKPADVLFAPVKLQLAKGRAAETKDQEEIDRRIERMKTSGARNFGPTDGICWCCKRQIFTILSGETDITGCPYCHRTYVD